MKAIHGGNCKIVDMLLKKSDTDINLEDAYGQTALSWYFKDAYFDDLPKKLVELGADFDVEDGYRETAIVGAFRNRFYDFSLLLMRLNRNQPARIMKKLLCIKEKQDKKEEEIVSMDCDDEVEMSSDSEY